MAYFVRIGAFRGNVSGVGSRGYHIFRRAQKVIVRWGAIEVRPGARFYWRYAQEKVFRFRSVSAAASRLAAEIKRRAVRERYSQLPRGQKIRRASLTA
jgi:hypothetical protein